MTEAAETVPARPDPDVTYYELVPDREPGHPLDSDRYPRAGSGVER
ncbi:hypothetical protein [Nocardia flavorosea]|uniref:Uncharacterized protein n=1 Tax=Nocardia flavorosea TaxID=53429 RepID=A0A846YFL9_9NOCA|nr:hypothetical protein [Nocardia flavorosea]NKY55948.1 hypothetical protein [Nocardia flavorosea]